jgi:hypothetical protein
LLLFPNLIHHVLAQVVIGQAELLPPIGQHIVNFTGLRAQTHEVERSAKTRLLHQTKRRTADALFKAGLHHPDLTHVTGQLSTARHIANAGVENLVNRVLQCRVRVLALI